MLKVIDKALMDGISIKAEDSFRKRSHYNMHETLEDGIHRLCVGFEPGTYVRPHRHYKDNKWELQIILRGRLLAVVFDDEGVIIDKKILEANGDIKAIEFQADCWHTMVSLEPGTMTIEVKAGPYQKPDPEDLASWAPEEGEIGCTEMIAEFIDLPIGDKVRAL